MCYLLVAVVLLSLVWLWYRSKPTVQDPASVACERPNVMMTDLPNDLQDAILYHGTTVEAYRRIVGGGLAPRGESAGNWGQAGGPPSKPENVYLTDHYPGFYAHQARENTEQPWLVLEVPLAGLNDELLWPDEDATFQWLGAPHLNLTEEQRRRQALRDRPDEREMTWPQSLAQFGTVAHRGVVPVAAITRMAVHEPAEDDPVAALFIETDTLYREEVQERRPALQKLCRWLFGQATTADEVAALIPSRWTEDQRRTLDQLLQSPTARVLEAPFPDVL
jgi:hypothetical protein